MWIAPLFLADNGGPVGKAPVVNIRPFHLRTRSVCWPSQKEDEGEDSMVSRQRLCVSCCENFKNARGLILHEKVCKIKLGCKHAYGFPGSLWNKKATHDTRQNDPSATRT